MRVTIFAHSTRGHVPGVMRILDETLRLPLSERARRVVTEHRAYMSILGGADPVPEEPISADPLALTINGLGAEVLRTYLLGELAVSLEYAWEASRRVGTADVDSDEGVSAYVWPTVVELALHGPEAAVSRR